MEITPSTLDYFGPDPVARRSWSARLTGAVGTVAIFVILLLVIAVRAAALIAGFACIVAGTLLLTLGGRCSAAIKLSQWRARAGELMRLWIFDLLRPLRGKRSSAPIAVLPV